MTDEFDDDAGAPRLARAGRKHPPLAARLVARLYSRADLSLRARMLACLVRPLGPLGLVAVASGAFADFVARAVPPAMAVGLDDAQHFSRHQVFELARFVEQVNPEALQQITGLMGDSPLGSAAFTAAAVALLVRVLRRSEAANASITYLDAP